MISTRRVDPAALAAAIRAGQIRPIYMVLADLADDRAYAVEALARWFLPSGEVVPPDDFIPVAEASELIIELDLAVAERAFADLARWHETVPELRVTVNLSGRHFASRDSVDRLRELAAAAGVEPATVVLELTETIRPADVDLAAEVAGEFHDLGFALWLDDFGSGRSGVRDLIELPLDGLKIDRPFARRLGDERVDLVVEGMTGLAAKLGLTVTLEGIEDRRTAERARDLGCHLGQGFLWPHGLDADQVAAACRTR